MDHTQETQSPASAADVQLTAEQIRERSIRWIAPRWMTDAQVSEVIARGLSVEESRKVLLEIHQKHTDQKLIRSVCQNQAMTFGDAPPETNESTDDAVVRSICDPRAE